MSAVVKVVSVRPPSSVTVRAIVNMPEVAYVWSGVTLVPVLPSPKSQS